MTKYIMHKGVKCKVVSAAQMAKRYPNALRVDSKGTLRVRSKRRIKPTVKFTVSLSWTQAEARRFAREYLTPFRGKDDHPPFTIDQFLDEIQDETVFGDFLSEYAGQVWNPSLTDYFQYVAEAL